MKMFHYLADLINYCDRCPLCKMKRKLTFTVGPEVSFMIRDYHIVGVHLIMDIVFTTHVNNFPYSFLGPDDNYNYRDSLREQKSFRIYVQLHTNKYCITPGIENINVELFESIAKNHLQQPKYDPFLASENFYFHIWGSCDHCYSSCETLDVFNSDNGELHNIGIERERYLLIKTNDKFELEIFLPEKTMSVSTIRIVANAIETDEPTEFDLIDIDLSDEDKLVRQLKMMTVFN